MNEDLSELLRFLKSHGVEFLVIGAHAVGFHARPRMTEDFDLWIGRSRQNAERFREALDEFGAPIGEVGAKRFRELDRQMVRIGVPPNMVDMLNFGGPDPFEEVYARRVEGEIDGEDLMFPSRDDLIAMKRSAGRAQDLADIESLERYR
jgi:predicted nucleotidyltransferase